MGKSKTPVTNLKPSGMSESSSKSKPPPSDEPKESKEDLSKGVKTNAVNPSGNLIFSGNVFYQSNPTVNSSGNIDKNI